MNYFCATEYAYFLKSIVATTTPTENEKGEKFVDRASKAALERYIYINVLREIMQVVAHYGLFPKLADKASEHAPQLVRRDSSSMARAPAPTSPGCAGTVKPCREGAGPPVSCRFSRSAIAQPALSSRGEPPGPETITGRKKAAR